MLHWKEYKEYIKSDEILLLTTRHNGKGKLGFREKHSPEMRVTKWYRFAYVNRDNIVGKFASGIVLTHYEKKYGVGLCRNNQIGKGLLIGHFGRIIINGNAIIGDDFVVAPGVVIGMDMRGKRLGVPTIGNKCVIHSNSVVVGKITIGDDVMIAPNTFVNFDVPAHSIVIGNPATIHHRDNATECYVGNHFLEVKQ